MQSHEGILTLVQHRSAKKKRLVRCGDGAGHSLRLESVFEPGHLQGALFFLFQLEAQHRLIKLALLSLLLLVLHHVPEFAPSQGQNFGHPQPIKAAPVLEKAQAGWWTWDRDGLVVFENLRNAAPRHILAHRPYLDLDLGLLVTLGFGSLTLILSLALLVWNTLTQGLFESGDVLLDLTELSEGVHVVCSRLWQVCHDWLYLWESWRRWGAIS